MCSRAKLIPCAVKAGGGSLLPLATGSIAIIGRDTGETRKHIPVSRPMRAAPHSQSNPMRVAGPQQHRELGHVRIRIGSQRAHVTFPKTGKPFDESNPAGKSFHPSVACHLRADTGALIAVLPADRLRFDFSRHFLAPGSRINSGLISAVLQDTSRYRAKSFQNSILSAQAKGLAVGVVGQHTDRRKMKCPTKALKDSTK